MSPEDQQQFILDKIRQGYTPKEIVESDTTKSITMHKVLYQKRQLIAKGIISEEEANNAMKKRTQEALEIKHQKVIDEIIKYTRLGYTLIEISEKFITDYKYRQLCRLKEDYIGKNGWFTKEELEEFKRVRKARQAEDEKRAFESLSPEEKRRIEERRAEEARRLEEEKEERQRQIAAKKEERKDAKDRRHQEDIDTLKEHIKNGKTMKEAAKLMKYCSAYIYGLKRESIQNGTWLTSEELEKIEKRRKQKLAREKKQREKKKREEKDNKIKENQLRIKKEVWELREWIEKGYTYKEISKIMRYSISYLRYLRRLAIADNIWFTDEAIAEFKKLRKRRDELEAAKAQKAEQEKLERERKEAEREIREGEKIIKALDNERKRKIRGYSEEYKKYRKAAKKEDRLEFDGEENVSTEGRRKFIEILNDLHKLDATIPDKDIEIVLNTLYSYPEFANNDSIKFLISDAFKKGGLKSAEKMTVELIKVLGDTKFYEPLLKYRRWMKKRALLPKINAMKKQGMNNDDISRKLGITLSEVNTILQNSTEQDFPDFGDK